MMTRRKLLIALGLTLIAYPLVPGAQPPPARIALLGASTASGFRVYVDAFREGLRDNGLVEGKDYVLDERWAEGRYERFPALVRELLQRKPAVIVATTIVAVQAAQQATKTVPIVMTTINDPVGAGLIASLARPGGNTTGTANLSEDTMLKQLETLHAVVPKATRIALLLNPGNLTNPKYLKSARISAATLGMAIQAMEIKSPDELDSAFSALAKKKPDALILLPDAMLDGLRDRVSSLALKHRFPSIAPQSEFADAGTMLSYGASRRELYRQTATYVKKIFDGAKPADLPVEQPTRLELVVNLKTAKALGITIPQSILLRADRVID